MKPSELGHLESTIMEILWRHGPMSVRDFAAHLKRPLAYTTVMTTLDRLYKKGLLDRTKLERAFIYSPRFTFQEWIRRRAAGLLRALRIEVQASEEMIASSLLDELGQHDRALLIELERQIEARRRSLEENV